MELPKNTGINKYTIKLIGGKQPTYGLINSQKSVKLETLKTYIETYLKTIFIWPFISPASTLILFNWKPDANFSLSVNYCSLNNLTIKNWYPLPLIGKALSRLGWAKHFTSLELTSPYHQMRIPEDNKWKTAFWTRQGHFEYQVIPFGLCNASAGFQGYINKILA